MATKNELERELEVLRAKLAANEDTKADVVEGEIDTPPSNGLVLRIGDEEFECRRVGTSWQMMQFAKAQQAANTHIPTRLLPDDPRRIAAEAKRNEAGMKMLATLYDTAMVLLKPGERDRFASYMDELSASEEGLKPGELEEAIGNVIANAGGEQGKAGSRTSQPSSSSSENTSPSMQVVSFEKGTVEAVPTGES